MLEPFLNVPQSLRHHTLRKKAIKPQEACVVTDYISLEL